MQPTVNLNKYRLDLTKTIDQREYKSIQKICKDLGYRLFDAISRDTNHVKNMPKIQTIETNIIFENQFNTVEGYRVFFWYESIVPNRNIKIGYYLTGDINKIVELQKQHYVCGFCGNRHNGHDAPINCDKCLGSEYLKAEDLHLTVMNPVIGPKRESTVSAETYQEAQKQAALERQRQQRKQRLAKAEKVLQNAKEKAYNIMWKAEKRAELLQSDLPLALVENFIYYEHSDTCVFGWRQPLTESEKVLLAETELSFDYVIK